LDNSVFSSKGDTTRQKILEAAATLFADKGFTETTIRELTKAVGLKNPASLYHHFLSKNAILEQMLDDYSAGNIDIFNEEVITNILSRDPTTNGIMACLQISFPPDRVEYFLNILCVMLHEQLRNPIVRDFMSTRIIQRAEYKVKTIIEVLKQLGAVRQDTDPDYWMKSTSSFSYSFSARRMLGIGDNSPDYAGMGMAEMMRYQFDLMLEKHGTADVSSAGSNEGNSNG